MSDNVDPLDTARVVDELERKVVSAPEDLPTPPGTEVPDEADDVPGTPEPPD